jgi:hypothetical protein
MENISLQQHTLILLIILIIFLGFRVNFAHCL